MATEKQRKFEDPAPLAEGDFWRITGIGEATQQRLHAAGIDTFEQLAALSPEEIAALLAGQVRVKERVVRQDWTGQARKLAETLANEERRVEAIEPEERQRYESFLVELLLEDDRSVRRTRITQVRSGEKASWAGWDSDRLFDWIAAQTILPNAAFSLTRLPGEPLPEEKPVAKLSGAIHATHVSLSAQNSSGHKRFYNAGQALELQLTLDLSETAVPEDVLLAYRGVSEARDVQTGRRIRLGEIQGECAATKQIPLSISIPGMEQGTYALETAVELDAARGAAAPGETGLRALCEAGLVHIYARDPEPAG